MNNVMKHCRNLHVSLWLLYLWQKRKFKVSMVSAIKVSYEELILSWPVNSWGKIFFLEFLIFFVLHPHTRISYLSQVEHFKNNCSVKNRHNVETRCLPQMQRLQTLPIQDRFPIIVLLHYLVNTLFFIYLIYWNTSV